MSTIKSPSREPQGDTLLKNEKSQKVGVKTKRLTAGWNDDYLEQVLFGT